MQPSIKRTLGECILISSLPGKAKRTLVDIARLACYSIYQLIKLFTLQTSEYDDFCVISASLAMAFKKCNVIMT